MGGGVPEGKAGVREVWASLSRGMNFSRIKAAALVFAFSLTSSFAFPAAAWLFSLIAIVSFGLVMASFMFTQVVLRDAFPFSGKHFFREQHCDQFKFMVIDEGGRLGFIGFLIAEEVRGKLMKQAEEYFGEVWARDRVSDPQPK